MGDSSFTFISAVQGLLGRGIRGSPHTIHHVNLRSVYRPKKEQYGGTFRLGASFHETFEWFSYFRQEFGERVCRPSPLLHTVNHVRARESDGNGLWVPLPSRPAAREIRGYPRYSTTFGIASPDAPTQVTPVQQ